jgi:hypothetical protein
MSVEEYLTGIDWFAAIAIAAGLVALAMVLLRFLMATTSEVGHMLPGAGTAAGRAILDARDLPIDSWVCPVCRSVNLPQAIYCYRGCGDRDDLADRLPARIT